MGRHHFATSPQVLKRLFGKDVKPTEGALIEWKTNVGTCGSANQLKNYFWLPGKEWVESEMDNDIFRAKVFGFLSGVTVDEPQDSVPASPRDGTTASMLCLVPLFVQLDKQESRRRDQSRWRDAQVLREQASHPRRVSRLAAYAPLRPRHRR